LAELGSSGGVAGSGVYQKLVELNFGVLEGVGTIGALTADGSLVVVLVLVSVTVGEVVATVVVVSDGAVVVVVVVVVGVDEVVFDGWIADATARTPTPTPIIFR